MMKDFIKKIVSLIIERVSRYASSLTAGYGNWFQYITQDDKKINSFLQFVTPGVLSLLNGFRVVRTYREALVSSFSRRRESISSTFNLFILSLKKGNRRVNNSFLKFVTRLLSGLSVLTVSVRKYRRANKLAYILPIFIFLFTAPNLAEAQWMKIDRDGGNPVPSAALEISDTARGLLPPRLTTTQMQSVSSPADGLFIYNIDSSKYYYFDGTNWESLDGISNNSDTLDENVFSARVSATGVVNSQNREFIASVNHSATGTFVITWNSGIFTETPSVSTIVRTTGSFFSNAFTNATGATVYVRDDNGTLSDKGFDIFVQRQGSDYRYNTSGASASALAGGSDTLPLIKDGDDDTYITTVNNSGADNDNIRVLTNGSERMRIKSTGELGIGTATPHGLLTISGDSSNLFTIKSTDNAKNNGLAFQNTSYKYSWTMKRVNSSRTNYPDLVIAGGNVSSSIVSLDERFRITNDGLIGIGEPEPEDELVIIDTGIVAMRLGVDQTDKYLKLDYNEDFDIASIQSGEYGGTTHPLILQGGGGQVGIGGEPQNASLDIVSGASNRGIHILNNRNTGYTEMIRGFDTTLTGNGGAGQDLSIALGKKSTTNNAAWMGYRHYYDDSDSNSLTFNVWNNKYLMNITGAGNVGVGTQYPDSTLTVEGGIKTTYFTMTDGTALNGKVLTSDGDGVASWQTPSVGAVNSIQDADNDTKIQVEKSAGEDLIRFDIGGVESFVMDTGRIEFLNSGGSVALGEGAGAADDHTNNNNVFIGKEAGKNLTTGSYNIAIGSSALSSGAIVGENVAIGFQSLLSNVIGGENVAVGNFSLLSNTSGKNTAVGLGSLQRNTSGSYNVSLGYKSNPFNQQGANNTILGAEAGYVGSNHDKSGNVMIGFRAGYNESGSNKLIIHNDSTSSPLIYGEFDNDSLRFNGNLAVSSNTSGDARLYIEADTDNSNENDNPSILLSHDGGGNTGFIGLVGDDHSVAAGAAENALIMGTIDKDIQFYTDGAVRMTIDNNSNEVGIGTTTPGNELHVVDSTGGVDVRAETFDGGSTANLYLQSPNREWRLVNDTDGKLRVMDDGNSETFMVFDTLGRIGIDEFSPDAKLEVTGRVIVDTLEVDGEYSLPYEDGGPNEIMVTDGSGDVTWQPQASSPWSLDNDTVSVLGKNVGIGTNSPQSKLEVSGAISLQESLKLNGNSRSQISNTTDANRRFLSLQADTGGGSNFYIYGNQDNAYPGALRFVTNSNWNNPKLIVDSSGNVGVGQPNPTYKIDVKGSTSGNDVSMRINSVGTSHAPALYFDKANDNETTAGNHYFGHLRGRGFDGTNYEDAARISFRADGLPANDDVPGRIEFHTTPDGSNTLAERMRIDNAGNVGIGTTAPAANLHVFGGASGQTFTNVSGLSVENNGTSNSFYVFQTATTGGGKSFSVTNAGNVGIGITSPSHKLHVNGSVAGTSAYNNLSDSTYKTNLASISNGLDKILALRPLSYDWKKEEFPEIEFETGKGLGFIAQEVESIVPEMVLKDERGIYSLQYSELIPVLTKAIQEQQAIIENLKTENRTLKSEVENEKATNNSQKSEIEEINAKLEIIEQMLNEGESRK